MKKEGQAPRIFSRSDLDQIDFRSTLINRYVLVVSPPRALPDRGAEEALWELF